MKDKIMDTATDVSISGNVIKEAQNPQSHNILHKNFVLFYHTDQLSTDKNTGDE